MEKYYPQAVHGKAEKLEKLLMGLEEGQKLESLCRELELELSLKRVEQLKQKYEAGGRQREALLDGRFGHSQHVNSAIRAYLYERKQEDQELTASELAAEVVAKYQVQISKGHINHILRQMALTRRPGRPRKRSEPEPEEKKEAPQANVGLFFPGGGEGSDGAERGSRRLSE